MPTTQTPTRGIHLLPVELLQRIFELHTLVNLDSPHVLRQVCRHWLAIVDSITMLRTRIFFGGRMFRHKGMVVCYSLGHLLQAIQQTQNFQHELTIAVEDESMAALTQPGTHTTKWVEFISSGTSRCRRLTIRHTDWAPHLRATLGNCDFPELCELDIGASNRRINSNQFFDAIQRSSIHLRDLAVNDKIIPSLLKYSHLLRRLTKLSLTGFGGWIPSGFWEHLIHLVDLTVVNEIPLRDYAEVTLPSLSHMKIGIYPGDAPRPLAIYLQITNLTVILDTSQQAPTPPSGRRLPVNMPRLQRLEIHSFWLPICTIHAPNLSILVLREGRRPGGQLLRPEDRVRCQPRVLHIDMGTNILDDHLIRRLCECWADIEALHLTYVTAYGSPSFVLRKALVGSAADPPKCPRLKTLEFLLPPPLLKTEIQRKNTLQGLRRIAQNRRAKNMLEGGHCGWFQTYPLSHQKTTEEASRDWWNIEWFNLLE